MWQMASTDVGTAAEPRTYVLSAPMGCQYTVTQPAYAPMSPPAYESQILGATHLTYQPAAMAYAHMQGQPGMGSNLAYGAGMGSHGHIAPTNELAMSYQPQGQCYGVAPASVSLRPGSAAVMAHAPHSVSFAPQQAMMPVPTMQPRVPQAAGLMSQPMMYSMAAMPPPRSVGRMPQAPPYPVNAAPPSQTEGTVTGKPIGEPLLRRTRDGKMTPVDTLKAVGKRDRRRANYTKVAGSIGQPLVSDALMEELDSARKKAKGSSALPP